MSGRGNGGNLFGRLLAAFFGLTHSGECGLNPVGNARWQLAIRPLGNRRWSNSDGFGCAADSSAKLVKGLLFVHVRYFSTLNNTLQVHLND